MATCSTPAAAAHHRYQHDGTEPRHVLDLCLHNGDSSLTVARRARPLDGATAARDRNESRRWLRRRCRALHPPELLMSGFVGTRPQRQPTRPGRTPAATGRPSFHQERQDLARGMCGRTSRRDAAASGGPAGGRARAGPSSTAARCSRAPVSPGPSRTAWPPSGTIVSWAQVCRNASGSEEGGEAIEEQVYVIGGVVRRQTHPRCRCRKPRPRWSGDRRRPSVGETMHRVISCAYASSIYSPCGWSPCFAFAIAVATTRRSKYCCSGINLPSCSANSLPPGSVRPQTGPTGH